MRVQSVKTSLRCTFRLIPILKRSMRRQMNSRWRFLTCDLSICTRLIAQSLLRLSDSVTLSLKIRSIEITPWPCSCRNLFLKNHGRIFCTTKRVSDCVKHLVPGKISLCQRTAIIWKSSSETFLKETGKHYASNWKSGRFAINANLTRVFLCAWRFSCWNKQKVCFHISKLKKYRTKSIAHLPSLFGI